MSSALDTVLVFASVSVAVAYLVWRKLRLARKVPRDWTSGHVEACDHCPIIEIRKAKERIQLTK